MRLESKFKVSRLAKYALLVYVMISLFYTTNHYFSSHYVNNTTPTTTTREQPLIQKPPPPTKPPVILESQPKSIQEGRVVWPGPKGSENAHTISEDLMRSKIFSSSMGLDNVTPYYFKASQIKNKNDITLATLVTRNRFKVLSNLATNYKGPISAAIHVMDDGEKTATIKELRKIYSANSDMRKYVDVHLIIDKFDRQFNMWRNTAKLFTRTDYLMMLDVDFHLCTDFRKSIFGNPQIADMLAAGKTAIVVPAFEYIDQKDGNDWRTFPTNKQEVIKQVRDQKLDSFHSSWVSGHGATNYTRWYSSDDMYPVTEYEYSYEPYVIYKKEGTPWCDERFIGYGANKAACLFEIFVSGVEYYVLPHDFLIHQSHKYANHDRVRERVHNKELYDHFRTEVCLRYSRKYVIEDTWYTSAADNMKKVCTDIPKWKYLSGISKEQRLKDEAEEQALRELEASAQQTEIDVINTPDREFLNDQEQLEIGQNEEQEPAGEEEGQAEEELDEVESEKEEQELQNQLEEESPEQEEEEPLEEQFKEEDELEKEFEALEKESNNKDSNEEEVNLELSEGSEDLSTDEEPITEDENQAGNENEQLTAPEEELVTATEAYSTPSEEEDELERQLEEQLDLEQQFED